MTLSPVTGIEVYVKADGRLTFAGQQLWQQIVSQINTNETGIAGHETRITTLENGTLIAQAEREVLAAYGDVVSVVEKAKSIFKFGKNTTLGATNETVWPHGTHEVYVSTNAIDTVSSSSASDTEELTIEGHTISGGVFTFVSQTATLNGQNKVVLGTPIARCSRVSNGSATDLVGAIHVYEDTAITGGVPTDLTKDHAHILAGDQQTYKAATTFSNTDYAFITSGYVSVDKKTTASVDFTLELRLAGGVFRPVLELATSTNGGPVDMNFEPYLVVPKNADIRVTASASTTNVSVHAGFQALLAGVQ